MFEHIVTHFNEQIDTASMNTESLTPFIAESATLLAQTLAQGSIYSCTSCDNFVAGFELNRLLLSLNSDVRPSLPSIFLNLNQLNIGRNNSQALASQLQHLAKPSDLLIIFSLSGNEPELSSCLADSQELNLPCLLIAPNNSPLTQLLSDKDSLIPLPELKQKSLIQLQVSLAHLLIELAEFSLFGIVEN
ncbi:MAG: hypothetical protein KAG18_02860 [Sinobacterium sp.]|nr:hypothetical protein [Sinobacterium sp.]